MNGNLTNDSQHTYTWDADGNSVTIGSVGLTFDALDRMVEQNRSGSYTQIVYGPQGNKLALMNGQTLSKGFVPLSGGATAVYTSGPTLSYYRHADWLGSSRLASTPTRTLYYDGAYAPFGENYAETGTTDRNFTGQNQDTISTGAYPLYDFLYREYHPTWGRWVSPDPAGLGAVNLSNPQTWNRYAYVTNNPLALTDPFGLQDDDCSDPWYAASNAACGPLPPCYPPFRPVVPTGRRRGWRRWRGRRPSPRSPTNSHTTGKHGPRERGFRCYMHVGICKNRARFVSWGANHMHDHPITGVVPTKYKYK